jgi:hypothetical protein
MSQELNKMPKQISTTDLHDREPLHDEILPVLQELVSVPTTERGYIDGVLYVVSAPHEKREHWYQTVKDMARQRGFTAVAGYELEPYISMSPLNIAHILIERADAILFDITNITSGVAYQLGYAYAIGNISKDVVVLQDVDDVVARAMFCPYEVVPYADVGFRTVLANELDRLVKVRPYLKSSSTPRSKMKHAKSRPTRKRRKSSTRRIA